MKQNTIENEVEHVHSGDGKSEILNGSDYDEIPGSIELEIPLCSEFDRTVNIPFCAADPDFSEILSVHLASGNTADTVGKCASGNRVMVYV
jgi:hypothetical protein